MPTWLQSSVTPNQVSNTVRGLTLAMAGTLINFADWIGFPLTHGEVSTLAAGLGIAAGLLWAIYGLLMKLVMRIAEMD